MATTALNTAGLHYPLTKMNFYVEVDGIGEMAAFNEITGLEASVDVIEFRQGNAHSLAPVKIQGLVKHGNITMKMGYTRGQEFKQWILDCVSERRGATPRHDIKIELIDISSGAPSTAVEAIGSGAGGEGAGPTIAWQLVDAWVTKYTGVDFNATTSEVAIESVEIAYEELIIPN